MDVVIKMAPGVSTKPNSPAHCFYDKDYISSK